MPSAKKLAFLDKKRKLKEEKENDIKHEKNTVEPPAKRQRLEGKKHIKVKKEKPAIDPENKNSTLFVRNLSFKTSQEQLESFFSAVSPVKHTVIITNPETKISLGYGFVSFATAEDASLARAQLSMEKLDDRLIKIDFAEKRARKDETQAAEKANRKHERVEAKKEASNAELIIRNLSFKIRDQEQLKTVFGKYGAIREIRIPRGVGQKMMGFAFVVFKKRESATKAIEGVNGFELDGRPIAVDWSVKKDDVDMKEESEDEEIKEESDSTAEADSSSEELEEDLDSDSEAESNSEESRFDEVEEGKDIKEEDENTQQSSTLFIRNLLFETTEQQVYTFFREFGPLRYARLVLDHFTQRSRGSAFVSFVHVKDAQECLALYRSLPKNQTHDATSLLLSEERKEGAISRFILGGRLLDINESLSKGEAAKKVDQNDADKRASKGKGVDRRNLFLLNEGRIGGDHPLLSILSEADKSMRSASYTQRKSLVTRNPGLHLSLTRLSIRNLPRHIGDKELKYLARQSIVGFGQDVANGTREPISKEEIARDGGNKGSTGVVKQSKVVLEKDGSRSRGYGFLSFASHRFALMALRWLNVRQIGANLDLVEMKNAKPLPKREVEEDRKRRLIVEFAIENVSVVKRRADKEQGMRQKVIKEAELKASQSEAKRVAELMTPEEKEAAKTGKIIAQKRMMRKNRRNG